LLGRSDWLHLLRFRQPCPNGKFVCILRAGATEAAILQKKPDHFPMPGPCLIGVSFQVSQDKWKNPAPVYPEHLVDAGRYLFGGRLTGEEGSRQCGDEQRIWRARRQQSAPTSPAMREPVCVDAQ
jgi:hypothetical protein